MGSEEVDQFLRTMPELVCVYCSARLRDEFYRLEQVVRDLQIHMTNEQLSWFSPSSSQVFSSGSATRAAQRHQLPLRVEAEYNRALDDRNKVRDTWVQSEKLTRKHVDQGSVCSVCGGTTIR